MPAAVQTGGHQTPASKPAIDEAHLAQLPDDHISPNQSEASKALNAAGGSVHQLALSSQVSATVDLPGQSHADEAATERQNDPGVSQESSSNALTKLQATLQLLEQMALDTFAPATAASQMLSDDTDQLPAVLQEHQSNVADAAVRPEQQLQAGVIPTDGLLTADDGAQASELPPGQLTVQAGLGLGNASQQSDSQQLQADKQHSTAAPSLPIVSATADRQQSSAVNAYKAVSHVPVLVAEAQQLNTEVPEGYESQSAAQESAQAEQNFHHLSSKSSTGWLTPWPLPNMHLTAAEVVQSYCRKATCIALIEHTKLSSNNAYTQYECLIL